MFEAALFVVLLDLIRQLLLPPTGYALAGAGDVPLAPKPEPKAWEQYLQFKKDSDAPEADPLVGQAALKNAELGKEWLDFSKEQFGVANERQAGIDALTTKVAEQQLADSQKASTRSDEQYARWEKLFAPVQEDFVDEAANYATPEKQAEAAAAAKADVQANAALQQQGTERQLASMGVNPHSGRFAGIKRGADTATALASADAQNKARERVRTTGLALKEGVANMGQGSTSTAAQQLGLSTQSGNSAVGNTVTANNSWGAANGIMNNGFQGAIGANQSAGNLAAASSGIQMQGYNADRQASAANSAGIMGAVGTLGGAGMMAVAL